MSEPKPREGYKVPGEKEKIGVWDVFTPEQHKFMIELCAELIETKQHGEVRLRLRNGRLHSIESSKSWLTRRDGVWETR